MKATTLYSQGHIRTQGKPQICSTRADLGPGWLDRKARMDAQDKQAHREVFTGMDGQQAAGRL